MGWVKHVAHIEQTRNLYNILVTNYKRYHFEQFGVNKRIVLKCDLKKQIVTIRTYLTWIKLGTSAGSCEHDNETSDSIKCAAESISFTKRIMYHGVS